MLAHSTNKEETFEGVIKAVDWDEGGNIQQIVLVTKEGTLQIHMDLKAESLTDYCKEKMRVKGVLFNGELWVHNYKFLKH